MPFGYFYFLSLILTNLCYVDRNDPHLPLTLQTTKENTSPSSPDMLFCTNDMCPVKIHWHVKLNYQEYWRVKITITNRDISRNYTLWNLVAQHPNFANFTESFSFSYKPLNPYSASVSKFLKPVLCYSPIGLPIIESLNRSNQHSLKFLWWFVCTASCYSSIYNGHWN